MAFNVRVHGYRGTIQIPHHNATQFSSDSYFVLNEPYEWAELLTVNGATPPAFTTQNPDKSVMVRIEVPDGQAIRYEFNPPGRAVVVSINSPKLTGSDNFPFGAGWAISMADAAAFA